MSTMKLAFLTTLLLALSAQAQLNDSNVIGHWKFHRIQTTEKLDADGMEMMNHFFGDMSVNITSDHNYQLTMMKKVEEGKWHLAENKVIFNSTKGQENGFVIQKNHADSLQLEMQPSQFITFKREPQATTEITLKTDKLATVPAEKDQIAKKWFIKSTVDPNRSKEHLEKIAMLLEGSYFDFRKTGKYKVRIMGIKESGTWDLSADKREIIQEKPDNTKTYWKIVRISENELVLNKGDLMEQVVLSAKG